ncbi:MAG: D-alanine--D-serine ligase VanG [Clostridia bacterium]|nr:D-alanine--D-serine ligase VanG [Clostridia bacterium]
MKKRHILILFGGCSSEYEVSLHSAHAVITHVDREQYDPVLVGITRGGAWLHYTGPVEAIETDEWQNYTEHCFPALVSPDRSRHVLLTPCESVRAVAIDAAFPVLHGRNGEDGTVQGLLELAGIPLIGCGTLASALCMDKVRAHRLAEMAGVRAARSVSFDERPGAEQAARAVKELRWPVFVKPVKAGSSFGITKVAAPEQLSAAIDKAFAYDDQVIVEEAVEGFEVGCAVMGDRELTVGEVDEIELADGFFDYEEKYTLRTSRIHMPARIDDQTAERVKQTAKTLYRALGCSGFARVDLFLTPGGEIYFNEINTIPGFTGHSRYPNMMKGIGLSFGELVNRLIEQGLNR